MNEPASFCEWPCDDPDEQARRRGLPPDPPPAKDPPRPIPGFPDTYKRDESSGIQQPVATSDDQTYLSHSVEEVYVDHSGDDLLLPPYQIHNHVPSGDRGELSDLTAYTDIKHANGLWEYDIHNLYGASELFGYKDGVSADDGIQ